MKKDKKKFQKENEEDELFRMDEDFIPIEEADAIPSR
jgi:hypothetical protein